MAAGHSAVVLVGNTCPAAAVGADILVVSNFADAVDSSRLAGGGNKAAVVAGSVRKAQRLGGQEAGRWAIGWLTCSAVVVAAAAAALFGGCGWADREKRERRSWVPFWRWGIVRMLECAERVG